MKKVEFCNPHANETFEELRMTALARVIKWVSKTNAEITLKADELSNVVVCRNAALPARTSLTPEQPAAIPGEQEFYRI